MFRFLPSVMALQLVVAATTYGAVISGHPLGIAAIGIFILVSSILFAIWLKSLAEHHSKDQIAKHKDAFAKEREEIRVKAEKEKLKVVKDTQKQFTKDTNRANAKANFKVGAAVAGAVGVGALLVVSQMVTLGLLTLTTAGGGLAGYLVRSRQEKKMLATPEEKKRNTALPKPKVINSIGFDKKKSTK